MFIIRVCGYFLRSRCEWCDRRERRSPFAARLTFGRLERTVSRNKTRWPGVISPRADDRRWKSNDIIIDNVHVSQQSAPEIGVGVFFFSFFQIRTYTQPESADVRLPTLFPNHLTTNSPGKIDRAEQSGPATVVSTQPDVPSWSFRTRESVDRRRAMSENTRSSAFRKIDVDQFNENFKEDEQSEFQSPTAIPDESEITTLINQYPLTRFLSVRSYMDERIPISALESR